MSDNIEVAHTSGPESSPEQVNDAAWTNPMLARNNQPGAPKPAQEEPAPADPEPESPKPQSELQQRASAMDVLGDLAKDPQLSPVALFLDEQLSSGKVDADRAFGKAIEYGDINLIDEAYLQEALGDKAGSVLKMAKSLFVAAEARANEVAQQVYTQFGGKANVDQAVRFMNTKAPAEMRAAMGALLDSGVQANVQYAIKQIMEFAGKAGAVRQSAGAIPLGSPSTQRGLSQSDYREAIAKLPFNARDEEFQKLADLRRLGKQQGL